MKENKFVAADRAFSLLAPRLAQETDRSAALAYFRGLYATTEAVRLSNNFFPSNAHTYTRTFSLAIPNANPDFCHLVLVNQTKNLFGVLKRF